MKLFHTENAGVYIRSAGTGLFIDGIHGGTSVGFSPMTAEELHQVEAKEGIFSQLDGLLFTHLHIDHFQAKKVTQLMSHYPDLAIWGPGLEKRHLEAYEEDGEDVRFRIGDFFVRGYRTDHSGKPFQKEPHLSLLITEESTGENVFIAGDAIFYPEQAEKILEDVERVDMAFTMIYQLIEESSVRFLNTLKPERVLLYHRPKPEEDRNGLLGFVKHVLRHNPLEDRAIEVPEPHTWIE